MVEILRPGMDPRLRKSFKNFLWKSWRSLGLPDPTPLQYDMADYLQYGGDWIELMAFRGAAKSYEAVAFCLWDLEGERDLKVLNTSATARFAHANAQFAWLMLNNFDWLAHLKPRSDQRQSALEFDVAGANPAKDASFCAESIFGQVTGRRGDRILADDLEVPNTSETEGMRADLAKRNGELGAAVLKPGGRLIHLGTAQTEDTLYLKQEAAGSALRIYPILYPTTEELPKYGNRLAPFIANALKANPELAGTSTEPTRFTETDIARRELLWGKTEFARQFRCHLDAGVGDSKPLKWRDVMVLPLEPKGKVPADLRWGPSPELEVPGIQIDGITGDSKVYRPAHVGADSWDIPEGIHMSIDPSGEDKGQSDKDETTWSITAQRLGYVFLLHIGASLEGFSDATLSSIAADCLKFGVQSIRIEGNFGQGMFEELLRPKLIKLKAECVVETMNVGGQQKEKRIIGIMEPLVTGHRFVVNEAVLKSDFHIAYTSIDDAARRFYRFTYQFSRMTKTRGCMKHDDRIDGVASSAAKWIGVLKRLIEDAAKEARDLKMQEEADKIIEARRSQKLYLHGLDDQKPMVPGLVNGGMAQSPFFKGNLSGRKR